jgi:hypothetical protein
MSYYIIGIILLSYRHPGKEVQRERSSEVCPLIPEPEWDSLKASSGLNFVASLVANFVETTTKEPVFAASGRVSTRLATRRKDAKIL